MCRAVVEGARKRLPPNPPPLLTERSVGMVARFSLPPPIMLAPTVSAYRWRGATCFAVAFAVALLSVATVSAAIHPDFEAALLEAGDSCDSLSCVPDFREGGVTDVSVIRDSVTVMRAGDIDGDGRLDVVTYEPDQLVWYKVDGSESLSPRVITLATPGITAMQLGDINRDGRTDVRCVSPRPLAAFMAARNGSRRREIARAAVPWSFLLSRDSLTTFPPPC